MLSNYLIVVFRVTIVKIERNFYGVSSQMLVIYSEQLSSSIYILFMVFCTFVRGHFVLNLLLLIVHSFYWYIVGTHRSRCTVFPRTPNSGYPVRLSVDQPVVREVDTLGVRWVSVPRRSRYGQFKVEVLLICHRASRYQARTPCAPILLPRTQFSRLTSPRHCAFHIYIYYYYLFFYMCVQFLQ